MGIFSVFTRGSQTPPADANSTGTNSATADAIPTGQDPATPPTSTMHDPAPGTPTPTTPNVYQQSLDVSNIFATANLNTERAKETVLGSDRKAVEYLMLDDQAPNLLPGAQPGALPSRGWSDDLCYGTGALYFLGLSTGGVWGFLEGMRQTQGRPFKIRLNGVLNACTRRGPFLANSLGVVTMLYNCTNALIGAYRGKHDVYNSLAAAGISGLLFKSTAGVKPALIASGVCIGVAGIWNVNQDKVHELRRNLVRKAGIGHFA
ncbi:Mitochondrial import inner membrane translocase subunit tim23 [Tieghemiomyces parasiticus]|uniref:Mitochondrial import inner membrane translocase subunit tim23 n=1 Tax=Tieghemiomyces parasiticus TaxID=78921 RepID=A0A9W8AHA7_9FUNG|nr:Mitochondrial import inner membrane translocase subunit tim23 [Tieghemiomyces parasiticus]